MSEIALPLVMIDETGDVSVHRTEAAARQSVEACDVDDGVFSAYDSRGMPLALGIDGDRVLLERLAMSSPNPDVLESLVRSFIASFGAKNLGIERLEAATLLELLEALEAHQ